MCVYMGMGMCKSMVQDQSTPVCTLGCVEVVSAVTFAVDHNPIKMMCDATNGHQ